MEETMEKIDNLAKQPMVEEYKPHWYEYYEKKDIAILLITLALIIAFAASLYFDLFSAVRNFDITGQISGLIPLIPVLLILHANRKKQWTNQLPNFLTVNFYLKGNKCLRFEYCPLSGIADIRAQAQTITRIFESKNTFPALSFLNKTYSSRVKKDQNAIINNGSPFELHEVDIGIKEDFIEDIIEKNQLKKLADNEYMLLIYPFDTQNIQLISKDEEVGTPE